MKNDDLRIHLIYVGILKYGLTCESRPIGNNVYAIRFTADDNNLKKAPEPIFLAKMISMININTDYIIGEQTSMKDFYMEALNEESNI